MRAAALSFLTLIALSNSGSAQERIWQTDITESEAYLVFGVPETDDVGVSFWCSLKQGTIKVFLPRAGVDLQPDTEAEMVIAIAGRNYSFKGKTAPNEMDSDTSIEGELAADAPVFDALLTADRFSVIVSKSTAVFPLADADLKGLLTVCRK
jgi:hypothetical protein